MNVQPHDTTDLEELLKRIRQERDTKQRDRYRAILLALKGQTTEAIMCTLDRNKNVVQGWTYVYRNGGIDAIHPRPHTGRQRKLTTHETNRL
jgi:transposase